MPDTKSHPSVSNPMRTRVQKLLNRHGIPPCPLAWCLVGLVQRSVRTTSDFRRRTLDANIAQTQIDLRRELLGQPYETRGVRRNPYELDRVETAVEEFTDDLRTLFIR
jgi:hypothetical protein